MNATEYGCERSLYTKLVPHECLGLTKIRLGRDSDGGYVVPAELIDTSRSFVVFGVNNEDSFEMDLYSRTQSRNIILCDPFVPYTRKNSPLTFYPIGLSGESLGCMRTLPDFFKEVSISKDHIFLKIDIEKGEYPSFQSLTTNDFEGVDCLVIEIHGLLETKYHTPAEKLLDLLNESFVLYHIHANNNGIYKSIDKILYPDVIECTYISKNYLELNGILYKPLSHSLPDPTVDKQNTHIRKDYLLRWWLVT